VDAARYFILYHYGGVYLDMDIECRGNTGGLSLWLTKKSNKDITVLVRAMDSIRVDSMFPLTDPMGMSNDVMFASKGNSFFKELIEALPKRNKWYGLPYLTVMFSTGPMFLSLVYMNYPSAMQEVLALSPELYSETDAKFFLHLQGGTWHSSDVHAIKWLVRNRTSAVLVLISVIVLVMMKSSKRDTGRKEPKPL
jgi:mannosyltransferase OCH1-like enzyme